MSLIGKQIRIYVSNDGWCVGKESGTRSFIGKIIDKLDRDYLLIGFKHNPRKRNCIYNSALKDFQYRYDLNPIDFKSSCEVLN
jgi:hypothetical protein